MIPRVVLGAGARVLVLLMAVGLAAWRLALLSLTPAQSSTSAWTAVFLAFILVAAYACLRAAGASPADATGWRLLAAGLGTLSISSAAFCAAELFDLPAGWLRLATVFGLLFRLLVAMGLVSFPLPASTARSRWRARLELAVVATTVAYLAWGWVLSAIFHTAQGSPVAARAAIFTLLDIVLVILVLLASVRPRGSRAAVRWVGLGLLFLALTDWNVGQAASQNGELSNLAAVCLFAALCLVATGAWLTVHPTGASPAPASTHRRNLLPVLLAAIALSAAISTGNHWTADPVLLVLAIGSAASLLAWQVSVVLENEEMVRSLSAQGRRFQTLVETAPIAILETDTDGRVEVVNSEAARLLDACREDLIGVPLDLAPRDAQSADDGLRTRVLAGETLRDLRVPVRRSDGETLELRVSAAPIAADAGAASRIVWIGSDDGPRLRSLAAMIDVQRMRAFEQLTSGIAHDFNNRLTVILGTSEILLSRAVDADDREMIEAVLNAGQRAAGLVEQLVGTTRRRFDAQEHLDLGELVRRIEPELLRRAPSGVRISLDVASDRLPIRADGADLEQALFNLVANAFEAMPSGGSVTIRARRTGTGDPEPMCVELQVSDDGAGMDADVQARALEPFFTTKDGTGRSRGLGLPAVQGVVLRSLGELSVASTAGEGTCVTVRLPLEDVSPAPVGRSEPAAAAAPAATGAATILLVDDEREVRTVARRLLVAAGHHVLEAGSAEEALRILDAPANRIDLLLSDVVMPGRSGIDLAHDFVDRHPDRPVLLLSGYVGETDSGGRAADVPFPLLSKPIDGPTLLAAVADAVGPDDRRRGRGALAHRPEPVPAA